MRRKTLPENPRPGKYRPALARAVALALFFFLLQASCAFAEQWSFAVFSDSRPELAALRSVLEQVKANKPADPKFAAVKFVLGLGDNDPLTKTTIIYKEVFGSGVPLVPLRGNHETAADFRYIMKVILPSLPFPVQYYDGQSTTFYFDFKNARFISIDQYAGPGKDFKSPELVSWIQKAISSAGKLDHIFIAYHEPYLPFNLEKDPFWSMLLKNTNKVKAVLSGHMHFYSHRFIQAASGGIHHINSGNAGSKGHSDGHLTAIQVSIDGSEVAYRALQAPHGTKNFSVREQWPEAQQKRK